MSYPFLDRVNFPSDIRKMNVRELEGLCEDIRKYMIECCSINPGHLASSLGAVELIVGVHYVFDTPEDKFILDVGHQAYAHKILTGRKEAFKKNRTREGISGFPKISESPYDAFGVGHSSTSISAALGIAEAAHMLGETHKTLALIGDGSLTGGLAFEGLNNAAVSKSDLLVIINDNNHSIDDNTGGLHESLLRLTSSAPYNKVKDRLWDRMGEGKFRDLVQRCIRSVKSFFVKRSGGDIFESIGIRYFGPIDGNDIKQVVSTLQRLKGLKTPRALHCITLKGKGYAPAENDPTVWHAPGKFDPETGIRIKADYAADRYQDVFGAVLCELADTDSRVVGVTPAMASGCGMTALAQHKPERFFDVGIEEEHAVTFSAGLCAGGMKPFCNIYSSFAQRAYDQIVHDVALQNLPVVLCFDRAGVVGEDGATHQGAFDISAFRCIPNVIISSPKDEIELKNLMYSALLSESGPYIIRYPRGCAEGLDWKGSAFEMIETGTAQRLLEGKKVAVIANGPVVNRAMEAAASFDSQVGVYNFRFVKPLDEDMLEEIFSRYTGIITLEDGTLAGGLYGAVCEYAASHHRSNVIKGCGIPDRFIEQASQKQQREECGLSKEAIEILLKKFLENSK